MADSHFRSVSSPYHSETLQTFTWVYHRNTELSIPMTKSFFPECTCSKGIKKAFEEFSEAELAEIKFCTELLTQWQSEHSEHKDKTEFDKLFVAHQKYLNSDLEISMDIL